MPTNNLELRLRHAPRAKTKPLQIASFTDERLSGQGRIGLQILEEDPLSPHRSRSSVQGQTRHRSSALNLFGKREGEVVKGGRRWPPLAIGYRCGDPSPATFRATAVVSLLRVTPRVPREFSFLRHSVHVQHGFRRAQAGPSLFCANSNESIRRLQPEDYQYQLSGWVWRANRLDGRPKEAR